MGKSDNKDNSGEFNVSYGLASVSLTVGTTIVTTTQSAYHGISIIAGGTTGSICKIYDSISAASGNIIDMFITTSGRNTWVDRYIPVQAKLGLVVSLTGTNAEGAIFYGPKG